MAKEKELKSFKKLGVNLQLQYACDAVGWEKPTKIQVEVIPAALKGKKDIIGVAQTGSGKTGAFAIPILQAILKNSLKTTSSFFACVLSPTPEHAIQVAKQFEAFGPFFGVKCAVLVEGVDGVNEFVQQSTALDEMPHIVVATPGCLVDHLCNTNSFSLSWLKFLVLDEADRLLKDHFELVDEILNIIPLRLRMYLFSATMTKKMKMLQRAYLKDPEIKAASKYTLRQQVQEAKGISQMKIKEGGGKKRRKCDEDDVRNRQASKKKHHPGPRPRPRPLTELGIKLKDKQEELSLSEFPKKTRVEVHGKGSYSYKLVYPDGATVPVCIVGNVESDGEDGDVSCPSEESDGEDVDVPGPTEKCATRSLPGKQIPAFPPSPFGVSWVDTPIIRLV